MSSGPSRGGDQEVTHAERERVPARGAKTLTGPVTARTALSEVLRIPSQGRFSYTIAGHAYPTSQPLKP
eukprot:613383-Rhodomonas_salina.4